MSIEAKKKRLSAYMNSFKNYDEKNHEMVEDTFRFHAPSDIEFLLEQNQRLVEALEAIDRVLNFKEAHETWVDEEKLSRVTSAMEVTILTQQIEMTKALNSAKKLGLEALQAYKLLEKKD